MPWQAQIFIGQRVHSTQEAVGILRSLGVDLSVLDEDPERMDDLDGWQIRFRFPSHSIAYAGQTFEVRPQYMEETEGGGPFGGRPENDYTDAIVGFNLTSRYEGAILDHATENGRPEPFYIDVEGLSDILRQVREWWPEAQAMVWNVFY